MAKFFFHPATLVLGSSVLYILAYDNPACFWPFILITLVPFLFFIHNEKNLKQIFIYGFLFGSVTIGGVLIWFWSAYPLDWAGIQNPLVGAFTIFSAWLVASLTIGLFFGLWAFFFKKLSLNNWLDIFLAPAIWVLCEYFRSFAFALLVAGDSGAIGPYWTFGFLGYPLVWSKIFALLAPLGGVYLLSFIGVAVNLIFFKAIVNFSKGYLKQIAILIAAIAIILIIGAIAEKSFLNGSMTGEKIRIAVISTNFESSFSEGLLAIANKAEIIKKNLSVAAGLNPNIIILPEDSRALLYLGTSTIDNLIGENKEVLLVDSAVSRADGAIKENVFFYRPSGGLPEIQEKHFLVPYGEYLPYQAIAGAFLLQQSSWVNKFNERRGYEKGGIPAAHSFGKNYLGVLFCSEIIPENLYRGLAQNGAELFLNVSSQSIFHGSDILYNQTLSLAKMKAASNRRYFVVAGNFVQSFILNGRGGIIVESKRGENSVIATDVSLSKNKTPYTRFGDWILWLSALIIITAIIKFKSELKIF